MSRSEWFGQGPPDWWLADNPQPVPEPPPVKAPRPTICLCGRDYLTVPLDGPESKCPCEAIV